MYVAFTLVSCVFFIGIVAWYSYYKTKNTVNSSGGFFNIPIIAIVLVGIFSKRIPAIGPKIVIISHVIVYYLLIWDCQCFSIMR
ncbi:hypothetical protein MUA77_00685 [Mammaliicoccus sciuri]|uniref:hypothetical protein n=1 Tax=Mammaliicoccus sciuri TaxID=1296 RepID=UPI0021CE2D61|nr:hypothetical protein [Mammaliicoccus sciuri]UXU83987.1 hypothetical protein MUA77_00685 [Mammaliicoccus sciuri]UXU93834.1 hypothetical protein MUA42_00685 [Mammaliicoccus sciuri]UXV15783.1 hypothetical protein MUA89_00685 [Mammaliicoccus sciuri]UXV24044.1 hypothetical protein MUA49_00685 [Mammaliicoccus sciuri]UXV26826.1 hypothetical protein MUA96_00685 [Mammaliicoccus sciuri]